MDFKPSPYSLYAHVFPNNIQAGFLPLLSAFLDRMVCHYYYVTEIKRIFLNFKWKLLG